MISFYSYARQISSIREKIAHGFRKEDFDHQVEFGLKTSFMLNATKINFLIIYENILSFVSHELSGWLMDTAHTSRCKYEFVNLT